MVSLPGWDSLQAVSAIARWSSIAGIWILALLVVAEGITHVYDGRKESLLAAAEREDTARRQQHDAEEKARHEAQAADLRRQLTETQRQVAEDHGAKVRIRRLLETVDPRILHEIDAGSSNLTVRMQPADIAALQALVAEPDGRSLLAIVGFGARSIQSVIMNGSLGPNGAVPEQTQVHLHVDPTLKAR